MTKIFVGHEHKMNYAEVFLKIHLLLLGVCACGCKLLLPSKKKKKKGSTNVNKQHLELLNISQGFQSVVRALHHCQMESAKCSP